jgi:hypothetical protein
MQYVGEAGPLAVTPTFWRENKKNKKKKMEGFRSRSPSIPVSAMLLSWTLS